MVGLSVFLYGRLALSAMETKLELLTPPPPCPSPPLCPAPACRACCIMLRPMAHAGCHLHVGNGKQWHLHSGAGYIASHLTSSQLPSLG